MGTVGVFGLSLDGCKAALQTIASRNGFYTLFQILRTIYHRTSYSPHQPWKSEVLDPMPEELKITNVAVLI